MFGTQSSMRYCLERKKYCKLIFTNLTFSLKVKIVRYIYLISKISNLTVVKKQVT